MYTYDSLDQTLVDERVAQFRGQTARFLAGQLSEDEFRPLRLQNGLYIQKHASMLRVAIPYGMLSSTQVRMLAHIARKYDRGYGHFTTRQNIQFNWPKLESVPDIHADLASVQMHAIQTSGNCVRNTTSDQFAGIAHDELVDPRPYAELIRQWSTLHPEFAYLPRKFKIAVNGATEDRAGTLFHDIGVHALRTNSGEVAFNILAGGGLGRTPILGHLLREALPTRHLFTYLDAILRVYNRHGRRDNLYKARIKILIKEMGLDKFRAEVDAEWTHLKDGPSTLTEAEINRVSAHFVDPDYEKLPAINAEFENHQLENRAFARWVSRNVFSHKQPGYAAVTLSLKKTGVPPGDATDAQLDAVADLADEFSFGEIRVSHEQNLILADVEISELFTVWQRAKKRMRPFSRSSQAMHVPMLSRTLFAKRQNSYSRKNRRTQKKAPPPPQGSASHAVREQARRGCLRRTRAAERLVASGGEPGLDEKTLGGPARKPPLDLTLQHRPVALRQLGRPGDSRPKRLPFDQRP